MELDGPAETLNVDDVDEDSESASRQKANTLAHGADNNGLANDHPPNLRAPGPDQPKDRELALALEDERERACRRCRGSRRGSR